MRILKRSIALLLFICMMFSTMPLEFMQSAFAEPLGVDSPSLGVAGKSNTSGGVYKGNQVGFRIQLSRDSNNFLNGTQDQREKVLNYYSNKWPNGYDYGSNTIFFTSHDMYEWLWDRLKPGNAANSGGNVAIYTPSASAPDAKLPVYNTLKDLVIQGSYTTNVNLATANKFKNYALQLYDAGTVKDLGDFGNNIWLWGNGDKITGAGFPTGTEALNVLSTIFAKSGDNYKVVENITKFVEGNSTGLFMKDPSQMTEREKFEVSAGYAGLLIYFYSVIASSDTPNRAGTSATFETGINDYLMNANTEEKPVTLVIDTALALVENPNYYYITPTIDMIQYMALTSETEVLTNEANQIVVENLNGINLDKKNDTKQLIKEMYQKAVNRVSFGEVYTGAEKGDTGKPIRFADYGFGNMASLKSHAIPWAHDAFFFETVSKGYKGVIENTKENIVTTEGYATSHFPGYLSFLRLDNSRDIYGFVIIGNHIATPEPTVSYWVEDEIIVPPSGCAAEVQPSTLPTITVNIEGNSALISSMNHRKNDVNFQGIRMKATVKRTEYRNGFDEGCKYAVVEHVDYLEQQLNRSLLGDELLHILSGNPIILEDKSLLTDDGTVQTFMKSELGTTSIRYVYDINIDLYIDKAEYYFGTPGSDSKERIPIVYTSSDGTKYNFAEFVIPQLTNDIPEPEDINIPKPSSVDTTEIVNPSENENLAENNQMIKRHQFTSGGAQFAEIKNNAPLQEQYEVMAGVPSTEELYYSVGGNEFQVALVVQHWMNEHSRDRTYTVHFDGNICEYNNEGEGTGDRMPLKNPIAAIGDSHGSWTDNEIHCNNENTTGDFDNEIIAEWDGNHTCETTFSSGHCGQDLTPTHKLDTSAYDAALADAKALAEALGKEYVVWTSASDKIERKQTWTASYSTTENDTASKATSGSGCSSCGEDCHSSGSSGSACSSSHHWHIKLTATIPKHSVCGPCCGHHMPELWDTWRQGMVFDFAKIAQVRLYKLDQGSVDGLKELIGVDTVFASVRSGNPTYFMNIAQMTEKKRYGQDIIPAHFDTTESTADNIEQKGLTASTLKDVFITYLGTGKTNTDTLDERHFRTLAQSSRAGRLRYTLAEGQNTETITITEQGNGTGGTYTFDPNLISAPDQHDDVIYHVGARSKNCDGMATTNNFGKTNSNTTDPGKYHTSTTGHVNEWADGCLYTNIMEKTVQAGIPGCTTNTSAYSGYWDSKLYSATVDTQKFEENTLQTYTKNDIHYTKYKEDYNHHVVRPDVLSAVSTDMKKTAYNDAADERDTQTAEWQFFNKARRTKIVGHVISDFLILQTSGGDQSIFYYEKESEPTEAQEHFQKVIIEPEELFYNNPLSIFIGDTACKEGEGAKQQYTKDFIVVGGYNGQYNEVDDKYRPYNMQDGEFKKFYDEGWYVYNATEHRDESGNYAATGYLGNTEIKTIFDDDPAKTIKRPERQAKNQGSSFKIYQDNLQILPTNPNKLYTPGESKVFYSQVLGYYSIDRDVIDARDRSNIIGTIGNVSIGWPQQEKHGEYYKKYWGSGNGVDYTTKYFMLPMKDRLSGDVFSTATDSGSTTVNPVIVYTPVSTEDAIVMELDDFEFDVNGVKTTVSRDQRVNNFEYPNMNDLVNALKVCPLDPELCEYRYLDCKFHEDTVLAEFDFEDTYVEKNIKRVKQADGSVKQEIVYGETLRNTYHNGTNWVTTDKVSGIEYMLPGGFNVGTYGKAGNTKELYANGTRWAIPLNSLGLSTNKSNMVEVEMDLTVDSTANNLMLASFYHYGFVLNPTNTLGSFIARSEEDSSRIGPRMDAKYSTALNKVKVKIKFGFNNVVDCEASINGVPANLTVSDLKKVWNDDDNDGVRTLDLRQVEVQDWINDAPRTFTVEDIGTNLIIGSWGSNDNYKANYYIDNLKITLKGGTTEHNSTCYERLTVHQTKRIHVHDEDCYLKEDMYTCTGELNGNYQHGNSYPNNTHICDASCKTSITSGASTEYYYTSHYDTQYITGYVVTLGSYSYIWPGSGEYVYTYGSQCSRSTNMPSSVLHSSTSSGYTTLVETSYPGSSGHSTIVYKFKLTDSLTLNNGNLYIDNCNGILNTHTHIGTPGKDYENGCYTKPTVHIHNKIPQVLVCGKTEGSGGEPIDFDYKKSVQEVTLQPGRYQLEVWGAQGGDYSNGKGGKGGYSVGTINLVQSTKVYVTVGGAGYTYSSATNNGSGYNGGGSGGSSHTTGGGGGTDIRIGTNDLYYRVIVAGGGGGIESCWGNGSSYKGGYGGGETGGNGNSSQTNGYGSGGTQTTYGSNQYSPGSYGYGYGSFGQGGNGTSVSTCASGGGGGWYGGGASYGGNAGGGSGYVLTTNSTKPSGYKLGSEYYLSDATTIGGNTSFLSPTGTSETGHSGNGYARITPLSHTHTQDCYGVITDSTSLKELICEKPVGGDGQVRTYSTVGETSVTLSAGRYRIEAWGAQGGLGTPHSNTGAAYDGGKGGYSVGELTLNSSDTLYIYIGGQGSTGKTALGGVNGGGQTGNSSYDAGTGGGATHVGLKSGLLTSFSSDYSSQLLLVAGGGGGGGNNSIGGAGGGTEGLRPASNTQYSNRTGGAGGTQTSGYSFGQGQGRNGENLAGGGGGGFYGGGQGDNSTGGGGGSGYVNPNLLDSGTYETIAGNTSFSNTAGTGNETGHSGDGYVKITNLDHQHTDACYRTSNITVPEGYYAVKKCTLNENTSDYVETFDYTGSIQTVNLTSGRYKIEAWGAQGGSYTATGGKGAYVAGEITFDSNTDLFIGVGQQPSSYSGGWNGGGAGCSDGGSGGGGATHVATQTGLLSSLASSTSKVLLVAGAGGGGGCNTGSVGGAGPTNGEYANGTFGQGGAANPSTGSSVDHGGGGGGGYTGGGGNETCTGGYGGTNYISSLFTSTVNKNGDASFPNTAGTGNETGHSGHGYVKITGLTHTHTNACYDFIAIPKCDVLKKDSLVCHGRLNATTDYNVHVHTADCLTNYAEIDTRMLRYTGDVQTFVVPYTDEYTFEAYGPEFEGRTAYSRATLSLRSGQVLYIYVGGTAGYNDYSTDIRVTPPPSGTAVPGEEAIWRDQWNQSLGTRVISAGNKEGSANTFVREYQNCTPINGYTGMRGGAGNGRVIITCKNTQLNPTIYQQIINGDMDLEDARTYLGEPLYNKIMEGKEGLLHTWSDWSALNTKGFVESNNATLSFGGGYLCGKTESEVGIPMEFAYTGSKVTTTLPKGKYKLEVWGAEGANGQDDSTPGKGGYSYGEITIERDTTVYIYVGGGGKKATSSGAASGSGTSFNGGGEPTKYSGGGGGASDIRIGTDSLYARVIVAGGGGSSRDDGTGVAGAGGGINGVDGIDGGSGGTQISGYAFGSGQGGRSDEDSSNGGGGWYGGYGGGSDESAGGGSGWIYTSSAYANWSANSTEGQSGNWLLNSSYYLTNADTIAGNTSFTSPDGTQETGHSGDGYARITPLGHTHSAECFGSITYNCGLEENSEEVIGEYDYKGSAEEITLTPGKYKLEVWGASGGNALYSSYNWLGGLGGYSVGTINITSSTKLYVNVGGEGETREKDVTTAVSGGYNGGGDSAATSSYSIGGSGGGGTDIRIGSNDLYYRVIVAGGGGGAGYGTQNGTTSNPEISGGSGGGENGLDAVTAYSGYTDRKGKGATQSSGGAGGTNGNAVEGVAGSFGNGGDGKSDRASGAGGGGGWYGGGSGAGGSGCAGSGGGGSGYVLTSTSTKPSGYKLSSEYYLTDAQTIAGDTEFTAPDGSKETGHSGNGYARITRLSHTHTEDCGITQNVGGTGGGTATTLTCGIPEGGDGQVYEYDTAGETEVDLSAGRYQLEVWGAQGGASQTNRYTNVGGKGGYSIGELTLNSTTKLYVNVGGLGGSSTSSSGGGGGASHIGLKSGLLTTFVDDYTNQLFLVAGGGGGNGGNDGAGYGQGGYGGGEIGGNGTAAKSSDYGYGATQTAGGSATSLGSYGDGVGSFGQGGQDKQYTLLNNGGYNGGGSGNNEEGGGGGGGLYGGGTPRSGSYGGGGGGGSGYVNPNLLDSGTYETIGGDQTFTSPSGGTETGHSGDGYARITTLDHQHTNACYTTVVIPDGYVLDCDITSGHIHNSDCFKKIDSKGNMTVNALGKNAQFEVPLGNIPVEAISKIVIYGNDIPTNIGKIYLKDETGNYNENDTIKSDSITPNTDNQVMTFDFIFANNKNLSGDLTALKFELANITKSFEITKIEVYGFGIKVEGTGEDASDDGATWFATEGTSSSATLSPGSYKLEVWGAQGGDGKSASGGKGGYSIGYLTLNTTKTVYMYAGGQGSGLETKSAIAGGFNGGGSVVASTKNSYKRGSGGGASHISYTNNYLYNLSGTYTTNLLIVAGGGGGGGTSSEGGGAGGGEFGLTGDGKAQTTASSTYGGGGSQSNGGAYSTSGSTTSNGTAGTFGLGGTGAGNNSYAPGGAGGGGFYGGGGGNSGSPANSGGGGGGSGYINTSLLDSGTTYAGNTEIVSPNGVIETGHTGGGYVRITSLNTFKPLEITYIDPLDGCKTIIDANINLIPDKINGDYNPIWVCKFKEYNSHSCEMEDRNGNIIKLCKTHVLFNCTEPHHRGEHYSGSNRICWSACGDDTKHANTKKEVQINGETERLAQFVQLDAGFTVYFPNIGNFEGNNAHGLAATQITRGMGYTDNMDTTQWTREKRVKFPFEVIFDDKENGEMLIHERNTWIELDVETEFFNFYVLSSNPEMSNVRVQFEVEAINCGTSSGIKVKRDTSADRNKNNPYLMYYNSSSTTNVDNTVDKIYADKITDFQTEYINVLFNAVKSGYQVSYPNVGFGNSSTSGGFTEHGFMRFYESKKAGIETDLRTAMQTTDTRIEEDFEGTTRKYSDKIWPHTKSGDGINDNLKDITSNDNKKRVDNRMRSNSLESLHGGYKSFYLDVIGRIGNFAVTDTDDYRFSNFFKMPVSKMGALNMQDANNWLVEGVVEKVRDDIQNFYIGDTYDIRGNSASVETRWLDTYHTQSWMTGTFDPNTGERDINNPNLKSQILTGEANNIAVLKDEELRFGYDTYTSINTVGSYVSGNLQVIPKYYALKLTDNVGNDSYDKAKGTFVALDVYISKDGLYTPVNIFGNAANGKPNIQGLKLNDFAYNLDWTTESGRRNYTLEEKQRTQKLQDMLTIYDYGDVDLTGLEPEEIQAVLDQIEPEFNKLKIPYGKNNYMGSAQYMLLDGKHRTFIGTSESWGGNIYKSKAGTTDWGTDKNIRKVINNVYFEKAVQRWHGKLGVPSSSVFVPSGMAVNTNTIKYVMNEEWAIVCTAEIIAIGDVWSISYSQPWFKTMEINNEIYGTSQHYPGHRIYQGDDSVPCPNCIPPIIAVYSSESSSVDDVEIVQTH